ncbi:MAG TPA: molybdopterin-dependent oxidoreductase [Symbiobacteriaceae bacterium]|jgi:hypothetical protein
MTGPTLTKLHRYNGWNLLFLLFSGILLYVPAVRELGAARVVLRYLHIFSGVASVLLLLQYLPLAAAHWKRLAQRVGQQANVVLLVGLLAGWALTGLVLCMHRYLPPEWAESALRWHDLLTWFAFPWAAAHALTRYFKWHILPVTTEADGRRVFLAGAAAVVGAVAWGSLGRNLGVPGFSPPTAGGGDGPAHAPVGPGTEFVPPVASNPPEGGGGKGRFRVYTVTEIPHFHEGTWNMQVSGLVGRPLKLSWQEFLALPRTVQVSDFHCVTGWSVLHVTWEGVRLSDLLKRAGAGADAAYVKFYSGDGEYTDTLPISVARAEDVMLAYVMDGSPLPTPLGGPVRLIVPRMYGYKSVKWVNGVELIAAAESGYWEQRGYPADAWVQGETGGL